ncbi:MAG: hypothetical protein QOF12_1306, partial [Solirubrobacteraceae bacterium]|nr:hypothetical protein [Solirubrobacteraceae bacterium]
SDQASARGPPAGAVLIIASAGGTVTAGSATLTFAPGSLPSDAYVTVTPVQVLLPGQQTSSTAYDLKAVDVATGALIEQFNSAPVLSVAGAGGGTSIYYLPSGGSPVQIASTVDLATGTITAGLPHFSTYVVSYVDTQNTQGTDPRSWTITLDATQAHTVIVSSDGSVLTVSIDGVVDSQNGTQSLTGLNGLTITGGVENDALTVDITDTPILVPITFHGGGGVNSVTLSGAPVGTTWTVGATSITVTAINDLPAENDDGTPILDSNDLPTYVTRTDLQSLTFDGVSSIVADSLEGKVDKLVGPSTDTSWTVAGDTTGSMTATGLGTIAFSGFDLLAGGTGQDTLTGPNGGSTFHVSGANSGWFVGAITTTSSANDTGTPTTTTSEADLLFTGFDRIVAGTGGTDTLMGPTGLEEQDAADPTGECDVPQSDGTANPACPVAPPATWTITGTGAGTVWSGTVAFSGFEALTADAAGLDQVTGPSGTTGWTLTGDQALTVSGMTLTGFDALVGGGGANTLTGVTTGGDWVLTGTGAGRAQDMVFSGFTALVAGTAVGAVDRVSGPNSATTWTIGSGGGLTVLGLTLTGFDKITGGDGTDTLVGSSATTTWFGNGIGAGMVGAYTFTGFNALTGSGSNTITVDVDGGTTSSVLGMTLTGFGTINVQAQATHVESGTSGSDTIVIDAGSQAGYTKVTINGTSHEFKNPNTTLVLEGLGGDDTIQIHSLDSLFHASIQIYGADQIDANGDSDFSGWVHDFQGRTGGTDTVSITGSINTHGGSIFSVSSSFTISSGTSGSPVVVDLGAGDLTAWARDLGVRLENAVPVWVANRSATITIGNYVSILGQAIALRAYSDDGISLSAVFDLGNATVNTVLDSVLSPILGTGFPTAMPVKVLDKQATTGITIGSNDTITASTSLDIYAGSFVNSSGRSLSSLFSIGYVRAVATATVFIDQNTQLSAGTRADVFAEAESVASIVTKTARFNTDQKVPGPLSTLVISAAIALASTTAQTTLSVNSSVTGGTSANVHATGGVSAIADATSGQLSNGTAAAAAGISVSTSDIETTINGTITAKTQTNGPMAVYFDPTASSGQPGYWSSSTYQLYVGSNGFETGDAVVYDTAKGTGLGGADAGLISGTTLYVIQKGGGYIQLAATRLAAFAGHAIHLGADLVSSLSIPYTGVEVIPGFSIIGNNESVITKTFGGSAVDTTTNAITVGTNAFSGSGWNASIWPTSFAVGQAVKYTAGSGSSIAGLTSGQVYFVITDTSAVNITGDYVFAGSQVIKLATSLANAKAGIAIDLGTVVGNGFSLDALHSLTSDSVAGLGAVSALDANAKGTASAGLETSTGSLGKLKDKFANANLFQLLYDKLVAKYGANMPSNAMDSSTGLSFAIGIAYVDSTVKTTIGPNAVLKSNGDMTVGANLSQRVQGAGDSSIVPVADKTTTAKDGTSTTEKGGSKKNAVSVALNINVASDVARTTVGDGAQLDALGAMTIATELKLPFLGRLDGIPGSLSDVVAGLRSEPGKLAGIADGTLGLRSLFVNSWARAAAQGDKIGFAGALGLQLLTDDAQTLVGNNVRINQDTNWRDHSQNPAALNAPGVSAQLVVVRTTNDEQLIDMSGNFSQLFGLFSKSIKAAKGAKGGVGGAVSVIKMDNTTKAT